VRIGRKAGGTEGRQKEGEAEREMLVSSP